MISTLSISFISNLAGQEEAEQRFLPDEMEVEVDNNNNIVTTTEAPANTEPTKSQPKEPVEIRPQAKLGSVDIARR